MMKYQIFKDVQGHWNWRLRAGNNEIIARGEAYYNRADCIHAVRLVQSSSNAPIYDLTK